MLVVMAGVVVVEGGTGHAPKVTVEQSPYGGFADTHPVFADCDAAFGPA